MLIGSKNLFEFFFQGKVRFDRETLIITGILWNDPLLAKYGPVNNLSQNN